MKPTGNLKNIISLFSVDLGSKFLGFLATTYLARILGASGFGAINIGLAVLVYVQILSTGGLTLLGTKKVAEDNEDTDYLAGDIIALRLLLTLVVVLLTYIVVSFYITSEEIKLIVLVYILYSFPSAVLLDWFFSGKQKLEITSAGRISGSLIYLILVVVLVKTSGDIINTAIAWVIGGTVNSLFIWYLYSRYGNKIKVRVKRYKKSLKLLKDSSPLGLASLLSQVAIMFPAIYLGIASTTSEVGIYSAAFRLISLFLIFDRVFSAIFFPKIVNAISLAPERLEDIFNRILKIISLLALTVSIPMIIAGEIMIDIIFGDQFSGSVLVFQLLTGFFVFTLINSVLSYTLIAINKEGTYILALTISVLTFVAAVLIFYPEFFTPGIAIALIVYEVVQTIVMVIKFRQTAFITYWTSIIIPVFVSLFLVTALINLEVHISIKILIAFFGGIPLVAFAGRLKIEDIKYIKRLMI
jgi:O-antigen/teichoic acid export membrane protein